MIKKLTVLITLSFLLLSSGCSTYNSFVPNWATIGDSSTAETTENKKADNDSSWWNPFSWF